MAKAAQHVQYQRLLLASAFSWTAIALQGCGPETKADYLLTQEIAVLFGCLFDIFALLCCMVGVMDQEGSYRRRSMWFCSGFVLLCLSILPWISYGMYRGNQTCDTLRSMESDFCAAWLDGSRKGFSEAECCVAIATTTTTTKPGCQILFEQDSFFCAEWRLPYLDNTSKEGCCNPLPPCGCASRSDNEIQCEPLTVLLGPTCADGEWSTCFNQKRLCTTSTGCRPRSNDSAFACDYPTREQCNLQSVTCAWVQKDIYLDFGCHGIEPRYQESCASLGHQACIVQNACEWKMSHQVNSCLNGGVFLGCAAKSGFSTFAQQCSNKPGEESCALDSVCEWRDACQCPIDFVGRLCQEERAKFQADNSLCNSPPAELAAVCRGIVIASAADNDLEPHSQLCSKEVHECAIWEDVKATVARMWEVECGDCIVDGIAVLMVSVCLLLRYRYQNEKSAAKFLLLATLVSFGLDFALELALLSAVRDVAGDDGSITRIKDSLCFTQGGNEGQDALATLAGIIEDLAVTNIVLAVFGGLCDVVSGFMDCSKAGNTPYGLVPSVLASTAALLEFLLGGYNFWWQTREFVANVEKIEKVVLGLETFEKGGACFQRSTLLDPPMPAGVPWDQPELFVVAPGAICAICFLLAGCCAYHCNGKVAMPSSGTSGGTSEAGVGEGGRQ